MKLYTEEQIKKAIEIAQYGVCDETEILNLLTTIELSVENLAKSIDKTVDHEGMIDAQMIANYIVIDLIDGYLDKPYGADTNDEEHYKHEYKALNPNK
jgi:hypothetical protein